MVIFRVGYGFVRGGGGGGGGITLQDNPIPYYATLNSMHICIVKNWLIFSYESFLLLKNT